MARRIRDWSGAPSGFVAPPLHPRDAHLEPVELGRGVYALLSDRPPVDNSGFVVGEDAVLVIDSHINASMAAQIIEGVRSVTALPIGYVVNTNYHGDHTFGNAAFPGDTRVVAHRRTAEDMADLAAELEFMRDCVEGDVDVFDGVTLRLPDLRYDDALSLDLGGRVVQLSHFGTANTDGDTIVAVPDAGVAWTGNQVSGAGSIPLLLDGGAGAYLETVATATRHLDVATIVPGHGPLAPASVLREYLGYLSDLLEAGRSAVRAGQPVDELLRRCPLDVRYGPLMQGYHRWNLQHVHRELLRGDDDAAVQRPGVA